MVEDNPHEVVVSGGGRLVEIGQKSNAESSVHDSVMDSSLPRAQHTKEASIRLGSHYAATGRCRLLELSARHTRNLCRPHTLMPFKTQPWAGGMERDYRDRGSDRDAKAS